ncbi:hypothetical protein P9112_014399 [Eukaryota sp. TZLM1-RC]
MKKLVPSRKQTSTTAYCSWCFENTEHHRVEFNVLRRAAYCCSNCQRRTLHCRICHHMARGHSKMGVILPAYDDELCCVHQGLIDSWEDSNDTILNLNKIASCSHCREETEHIFLRKTSLGVLVYLCSNPKCQNTSIQCSNKDCNAHAKVNTLLKNLCIKCHDEVPSFDEHFPICDLYCSLCLLHTSHTEISPGVHRCSLCCGVGKRCGSCDLATGRKAGMMTKTTCVACREGIDWESIIAEMDSLAGDNENNDLGIDDCRSIFEQKLANYAEDSGIDGFHVPCIIMTSMSASQRIKMAISLDIDFSKALELERRGTLPKEIANVLSVSCREIIERLPFTGTPNWYKLVQRCCMLLFNCCVSKAKNSDRASDELSGEELQALENEFLTRLARFQRHKYSTQMKEDIEEGVDSESMKVLSDKLVAAGYSTTASRYLTDSLAVAMRLSNVSLSRIKFNSMLMMLNSAGLRSATPFMSMLGSSVLPILGLISLVSLSWEIVDLVFGSDVSKAFSAVVQILTQKMVLVLNGVDFNKYM